MLPIVLLVVLILASAFFSFSETALTSISRIKVKRFFKQGLFGSKALHDLRENPNKMLSILLVGNNLVAMGAASLATYLVVSMIAKYSLPNPALIVTFTTLLLTMIILVFGEIVPKTIAIKSPDRFAMAIAPVIRFFEFILYPVLALLSYICRPIFALFGADIKTTAPFVTEEELKMLLSVGEEEGVFEKKEKEMIHSIFEFGDSVAKEVMVPRPDMFCIDAATQLKEAIVKISKEGHSRIPVYEGGLDNIIGFIFAKDLLRISLEGEDVSLRDIMRPAIFVPETKKIDELMRQMQAVRTHIAIVVDEYGGVAGLVSLEDLLEEIVGEIKDEFDAEEKTIEALPDGSFLVDAKLTISEVNEKLRTVLPEGDYDTIGGFVLTLTGRIPTVGDSVKFGDLNIIIEKVFKRRVTRIRIETQKEKGLLIGREQKN